jgi:hypothetical protein
MARRAPALLIAAAGLALLSPELLAGRSFFWGDLTYLHHPWRIQVSQLLAAGELPLWNRHAYLGMPLAAQMQCAAWYPLSVPFYLFPFPAALALFHAVHFGLAGFFSFLWLRRWGLSRAASAGGAACFALCGGMASRIPFLNHLSVLAHMPALALFGSSPAILGLCLASAFLGGYPPMLAGAAAAAAAFEAFRGIESGEPWLRDFALSWAAAGALAAALSACLLLPGLDLALSSRRGAGMDPAETLAWGFAWRDLAQLFSPLAVGKADFSPSVFWWRTAYFGFAAWLAAGRGMANRKRALFAAAYGASALLLLLGASTPASKFLWTHLPPLRFIRYPGNTAYILMPLMAWLAANGLQRLRWAWIGAAAISCELLAYGMGSQPTVPWSYFADPGPLVAAVRSEALGHRYLLSPRALQWQRGRGACAQEAFSDVKHRLYGLTNTPFRLDSAGNFGEPLVPKRQYDFMDFLYRRGSLAEALPWLSWADVRVALTVDPYPHLRAQYAGEKLWKIYRVPKAERARWLDEDSGASLPASAGPTPPSPGKWESLRVLWSGSRSFRVDVHPSRPGWLFVSEPGGRGWSAWAGKTRLRTDEALTAFQKIHLPPGDWEIFFRYDPASWKWGLILSLLSLGSLAAYWYNRLSPLDLR